MKDQKDEHLSLPKTATTPPPPEGTMKCKKVCYGKLLTYTTKLQKTTTKNREHNGRSKRRISESSKNNNSPLPRGPHESPRDKTSVVANFSPILLGYQNPREYMKGQ